MILSLYNTNKKPTTKNTKNIDLLHKQPILHIHIHTHTCTQWILFNSNGHIFAYCINKLKQNQQQLWNGCLFLLLHRRKSSLRRKWLKLVGKPFFFISCLDSISKDAVCDCCSMQLCDYVSLI